MRAVAYTFLIWIAAQLPAAAQPAGESAPPGGPIPTRQNTFLIPFTVDDSRGLPLEIQLFVSADRGASWQLYARQRPSDSHFRFRAARDGEYWFAPKTLDQYNRVHPSGPPRAELKMLVDTQQPALRLDAALGRSGEVQTSWEASDPHLAPASLRIEYQDAVGSRWRPVALEAPRQPPADGTYTGSISWVPQTDSRVLNVRAEIQDTAGNRTVVNRRLFLPRNRATESFPSEPPKPPADGVPRDPFARPSEPAGLPWPAGEEPDGETDLTAPDRAGQVGNAGGNAGGETGGRSQPPSDPTAGWNRPSVMADPLTGPSNSPAEARPPAERSRWPATSPSSGSQFGPAASPGNSGVQESVPYRPVSSSKQGVPPDPRERGANWPPADSQRGDWPTGGALVTDPTGNAGNEAWMGASSSGAQATNESRFTGTGGSLTESPPPPAPEPPERRHYGLPPGEKPRLTNSRRFSLEYDVDAVGPAGVASVELWVTTDGGRDWTRWGADPDRTSPFEVEVDSEGVYGFRVVIVGNNGLAGRPPRSGDLADLWVAVDTTPPEGRMTSATYGKGPQAGQLLIRWEADDEWLGARPITLLFSEHLDGPWTTIASGLPNDGLYPWQADPRMPRKIYLRMEVRDQAGNVGTFQLGDAISVEGLSPQGRIRGLRPLGVD